MNKPIHHLTSLGLSEKEALVYITLLELGKATAYSIAKHSGLKRPTVYLLLESLRKNSLILKIPHAKNQIFIAKSPEEFFSTFEDRLAMAKRVLPTLLKQHNKSTITSYLFDGKLEMKKALEYKRGELRGQELWSFYGVPAIGKKIPTMYYDHAQALKDQGTKVRIIAPKDDSIKKFNNERSYGQDALLLPKEKYFPRASIEISNNYSKIFLYGVSQALVIENKEFSDFMKQLFELLWDKNKK